MLSRLLGIETEYAIRYVASRGEARPSHETIYRALTDAIGKLVATRPGKRRQGRRQIFVENGGAFYYELFPYAQEDGLVEGSTPECRDPVELLLYQRAQEQLLIEALPMAEEELARLGSTGQLGLLKNCRDAEGHTYGAQENYEVRIASGAELLLYRALLVLLLPVVLLTTILFWVALATLASVLLVVYSVCLAALLFPSLREPASRFLGLRSRHVPLGRLTGRLTYWIERVLGTPVIGLYAASLRIAGFRVLRRKLAPFLASRVLIAGAGSLLDPKTLSLSEKGPSITNMLRMSANPKRHAVFDPGNLMKDLLSPVLLELRPLARLFRREQRLQIGFSESNMCQVAELLRVGTTALMVDMIEAGLLADAPELVDPVQAIRQIAADPTLQQTVDIRMGSHDRHPRRMSGLELQRFYLDRAQEFIRSSRDPSIRAKEIVELWEHTLKTLETDPSHLVGSIDWVTKQFLVEHAGSEESFETKKKIDLRYHELKYGYFAQMEREGLTTELLDPKEIDRAKNEPPERSPARVRSQVIRELAGAQIPVTVSWNAVKIGGPVHGRVIRLDDYRGQ